MAKKPFFPRLYPDQVRWLENFEQSIGTFAAKYSITPAQLAGLAADRAWIVYWLNAHRLVQGFAQSVTAFKNEVGNGGGQTSQPPALPLLGAPPAAVASGVFRRALAVANSIKVHQDYSVSDGEALGLEGAVITPRDTAALRPVLRLKATGEHVEVFWKKNGTTGIEIWVKRGGNAWAYLATDTITPKYTDTFPLPATEEKWIYKAVYFIGDSRVGQWSEEAGITVSANG